MITKALMFDNSIRNKPDFVISSIHFHIWQVSLQQTASTLIKYELSIQYVTNVLITMQKLGI